MASSDEGNVEDVRRGLGDIFAATSDDKLVESLLHYTAALLESPLAYLGYTDARGLYVCIVVQARDGGARRVTYLPSLWIPPAPYVRNQPHGLSPLGRTARRSVAAPLMADGATFGLLCVAERPRDYRGADAERLAQVCEYIGPGVLRQKQREARERELAEARSALDSRLTAMHDPDAIRLLAGGVAHDINNLITAVRSFAQLARTAAAHESEALSALDGIDQAVSAASRLSRRLLVLCRDRGERQELVDVNGHIQDLSELLDRMCGAAVQVRLELGDVGALRINRAQLDQLLLNLCLNACQAMPDGGVVVIETARPSERLPPELTAGEYAVLRVSDAGHGIDPALQGDVFGPYVTSREKGTGLGLAICAAVARGAGGAIVIDSEPNVGTRFSVYLPRAV